MNRWERSVSYGTKVRVPTESKKGRGEGSRQQGSDGTMYSGGMTDF